MNNDGYQGLTNQVHVSRRLLEGYSHVRMETLAKSTRMADYDTNHDTNAPSVIREKKARRMSCMIDPLLFAEVRRVTIASLSRGIRATLRLLRGGSKLFDPASHPPAVRSFPVHSPAA